MRQADSSTVYVAFGGNQGDVRSTVQSALEALSALTGSGVRCSSFWASAPVGMAEDAGEFLNGVAAFETRLEPLGLLQALQALEVRFGRPAAHGVNQDRTLDLDILLYGDQLIDLPALQVPHPRMTSRLFVLLPLQELLKEPLQEPGMELRIPGENRSLDELIAAAPAMRISRSPIPPVPALQPPRVPDGQLRAD